MKFEAFLWTNPNIEHVFNDSTTICKPMTVGEMKNVPPLMFLTGISYKNNQ